MGISGVRTEAYSLRVSPDENGRGAQIDLLIDRRDDIVNLCEMKYANGKYSITVDKSEWIRNRIEAVRKLFVKNRAIHLTMITQDGIIRSPNSWDVQSVMTLDDLSR